MRWNTSAQLVGHGKGCWPEDGGDGASVHLRSDRCDDDQQDGWMLLVDGMDDDEQRRVEGGILSDGF